MSVDELIGRIKSDDADVRTEAWLAAGKVGSPAIKPLAELVAQSTAAVDRLKGDPARKQQMEHSLEVGRAATRAMWKIVRTAGAPGEDESRQAAVEELVGLLGDDQPAAVRREVVWMLSEIGCGKCAVEPLAKLLEAKELREDARMALERIPGEVSLAALREGIESVPDDFKINVAQSLRARGVKVDPARYPCQKLVPTKKTSVKPVSS